MKKFLFPILLLMIFSLVGCSSKDSTKMEKKEVTLEKPGNPIGPELAVVEASIKEITGKIVKLEINEVIEKGREIKGLTKGKVIDATYSLNTKLNIGDLIKLVISYHGQFDDGMSIKWTVTNIVK